VVVDVLRIRSTFENLAAQARAALLGHHQAEEEAALGGGFALAHDVIVLRHRRDRHESVARSLICSVGERQDSVVSGIVAADSEDGIVVVVLVDGEVLGEGNSW
jgi:hypothetical protein